MWVGAPESRYPGPVLSVVIAPQHVCPVLLRPRTQFYFPPAFSPAWVKHPHLNGCLQNCKGTGEENKNRYTGGCHKLSSYF